MPDSPQPRPDEVLRPGPLPPRWDHDHTTEARGITPALVEVDDEGRRREFFHGGRPTDRPHPQREAWRRKDKYLGDSITVRTAQRHMDGLPEGSRWDDEDRGVRRRLEHIPPDRVGSRLNREEAAALLALRNALP